MMGTIRWNFVIGLVSLVITFMSSITHNIWMTTILRSVYSFIILFLLTFLFRWVLGTMAGFNKLAGTDEQQEAADKEKGTALDLSTPDEEAALHQMLKDSLDPNANAVDPGFSPLNPPKLSTKGNSMEPGEMAQAVRRMTEE
ncbi:hypothetical protein [Paenibacillus rigui]|uniref:Uncharacterized protein n=1 Tax=Paenibacillus rigui TaxID=554312 RepID=A0A229UMU1_9BACL|nr:hypothetical protein [Paenibacillus rigui]OXM84692.1 hypothetical protein CF651_19505 [Paenibacillus rigui]